MRARTTGSVLLLVWALGFSSIAAADTGYCEGQVIQIGLGDATPFATIYYVIVGDTPDQGWSYIESNEVAGLQRGGVDTWPSIDPCQTDDPHGPDFVLY